MTEIPGWLSTEIRNWHGLTWIGGTFESDTGGTFHSDMPGTFQSAADGTFVSAIDGTFQSDMSGTFGPLLSPIVKGLEFSSTEILQIYHKMTRAYEDIAYVMRKWEKSPTMPVFNNWREILSCMRRFMEQNRAILAKQKGYSSVKRDISRLLSRENGGAAISGMLIDDSNAGNAISELAEEVFCKGASDYRHEYILLTNKIISKDSQYLNSCFKHFGWVIDKYRNQFDREVFKPILKSILDTYKPYFAKYNSRRWDLRYAEKDVVEHELTVIYKVYSAWGGKINFWDKYTPKYYI